MNFISSILATITLGFFRIFQGKLPSHIVEKQYMHNIGCWNNILEDKEKESTISHRIFIDDYIEYQSGLEQLLYGKTGKLGEKIFFKGSKMTAAKNSCEVIAVYNALIHLRAARNISFPKLLKRFSEKGIVFGGRFGTSPFAVKEYFKKNNYNVRTLSGRQINSNNINNLQRDFSTFIFLAYNKKHNPFKMLHTMCVTKEIEDKYVVHNAYGRESYSDLCSLVSSYNKGLGEAIYIIGLGKYN